LFTVWIKDRLGTNLPSDPTDWVHPNVLFTKAKWLRTEDCSVPVFQGAMAFSWHIRKMTKNAVFSAEMVEVIAQALADAGP
jgi:hypothetical protein